MIRFALAVRAPGRAHNVKLGEQRLMSQTVSYHRRYTVRAFYEPAKCERYAPCTDELGQLSCKATRFALVH